ncbi:Mobile element protein [uncultured Gammaproteobacteria bacterium]|nr:Mobile element protein [uncultured Gammaproteobacteria bacterium]
MLAKDFNIHYQNINGVHYLLTKLGLSWISARSKHPKQDKEAQALYKNFKQKAIDVLPTDTDLNKVDVWFQDETRIGQQGSITRIWAEKGTRPRAVRQQQFEYGYIFGALKIKRRANATHCQYCRHDRTFKLNISSYSKR